MFLCLLCARQDDKMATAMEGTNSKSQEDSHIETVSDVSLSSIMKALQDINKTMDKKFHDMENNLEKRLSDSMMKACEAKIGQVKKELRTEISKITERVVTIEKWDSTQGNGHGDPCKLNFIVRNMQERTGENVKNRVNGMIKDGLKIQSIIVVSAERKISRNRKPGVILATCSTAEAVDKVLKSKKSLKDCRQYNQVYIERDIPLQQRIQDSNIRNIASVIGEDKLEIRGSRIIVKSYNSERGPSARRPVQDDSEWKVATSRKRRRLDRSHSHDRSGSRDTVTNNERSHDRQRDNAPRDRTSNSRDRSRSPRDIPRYNENRYNRDSQRNMRGRSSF